MVSLQIQVKVSHLLPPMLSAGWQDANCKINFLLASKSSFCAVAVCWKAGGRAGSLVKCIYRIKCLEALIMRLNLCLVAMLQKVHSNATEKFDVSHL